MDGSAEQAAREVRGHIEAALAGVDVPVVFGISWGTEGAKTPPRRRWPHPAVLVHVKRKKPLWARLFDLIVIPAVWVTDPIGEVYEWLADHSPFRRRKRALHGGWKSIAGSMLAAHHTPVKCYLVSGRTGLHLVWIGELGSETGWSLPTEQVTGVEHLEWAGGMPHKARLRFHFADGSWGDRVIVGEAWQQMLSQFPPPPKK
ncbi:hypothetical protein GCM10010145_09060 [Streptomyces ruber]|uniref:Uncharacterized protein n=2 Tax=Streptomyces TaxID=1883 RepID=A0A918ER14_9ACTN|nr:hypothetical protein [Streptomyces ruber]GGQ42438.1 hypothetical protein GCM10010145_09060 [Streptomyces ruber]